MFFGVLDLFQEKILVSVGQMIAKFQGVKAGGLKKKCVGCLGSITRQWDRTQDLMYHIFDYRLKVPLWI